MKIDPFQVKYNCYRYLSNFRILEAQINTYNVLA